jgi:hypothetical protein
LEAHQHGKNDWHDLIVEEGTMAVPSLAGEGLFRK